MSMNSSSRILFTSLAGRGRDRWVGRVWYVGVIGAVVPAAAIVAAAELVDVAGGMVNVGIDERVSGGGTIPRPVHTAMRRYPLK
jgi:hypothetical protein